MKTIIIQAPADIDCDMEKWKARYRVTGAADVKRINIESRSGMEAIVAKFSQDTVFGQETAYYISVPTFQVAIPSIPTLLETYWITEKLIYVDMPAPDAVTVAQVLQDMGDF